MIELIVVAAVVALPVLWALVWRVNSALLFLSIATGSLLQVTLGGSVALAIATFYKNGPVELISNVGLVILPVIITLLLLRRSMKGSGVVLQIVPLIAAGAALGALLLPLLPLGFQAEVYKSPGGSIIRQSLDVVVSVAAVLNLLLAWRVYRHHEGKSSKHH